MYACICHAVTDAEVGAAVATGADSVKQIRRATGAGASCGSCVKRLSCMLAAYRQDAADPQAESGPAVVVPAAEVPAHETAALKTSAFADSPTARIPDRREHLADCPAAVPALG